MTFDEPADLILHGGRLTTLDPANPSATSLAVKGERILTVGSDEQALMHFRGPRTTVIDLSGRRAVPVRSEHTVALRPFTHGSFLFTSREIYASFGGLLMLPRCALPLLLASSLIRDSFLCC